MEAGAERVVDASVFASVIVKDEFHDRARGILERHRGGLITPELAYVEVASALWRHSFVLRRIPELAYYAIAPSVGRLISSSVSEVCDVRGMLEKVLGNAMKLGISPYDSVYVSLAMERGCGLLSFDGELKLGWGKGSPWILAGLRMRATAHGFRHGALMCSHG
jgi:predicted nucleic acid-binding protein